MLNTLVSMIKVCKVVQGDLTLLIKYFDFLPFWLKQSAPDLFPRGSNFVVIAISILIL